MIKRFNSFNALTNHFGGGIGSWREIGSLSSKTRTEPRNYRTNENEVRGTFKQHLNQNMYIGSQRIEQLKNMERNVLNQKEVEVERLEVK